MIRRWHTAPPPKGNGWDDIGYHFFICPNGKLEEGRPIEKVGAHCQGHNLDSLGICLGGLKREDFQPQQVVALKMLLRLLYRSFPSCVLYGHYELDTHGKTCPVFDLTPIKAFWNTLSTGIC